MKFCLLQALLTILLAAAEISSRPSASSNESENDYDLRSDQNKHQISVVDHGDYDLDDSLEMPVFNTASSSHRLASVFSSEDSLSASLDSAGFSSEETKVPLPSESDEGDEMPSHKRSLRSPRGSQKSEYSARRMRHSSQPASDSTSQVHIQNLLTLPLERPSNQPVPSLPPHHADTPTRLVVQLSNLEQSISRRFREVREKSDQIDQRVTNVINERIHGLSREDLAIKELIKAEKEERLTQAGNLMRDTTDKFAAARGERVSLFRNTERLRRALNSLTAKHDDEVKRLATGTAQNFVVVQQEITRLFNTVNKLSQIQTEEPASSLD